MKLIQFTSTVGWLLWINRDKVTAVTTERFVSGTEIHIFVGAGDNDYFPVKENAEAVIQALTA